MIDLRLAFRSLRRSPSVTIGSIAMLAIGIAVTTALFAVVDATFLAALPYRAQDRLLVLFGTFKQEGPEGRHSLSYQELRQIAARSTAIDAVAAYAGWRTLNLGADNGGEPERVYVNAVSPEYFGILDAAPLVGRTFTPTEGQTPMADWVAVISERLWRDRFGGRPDAVGSDVRLSERTYRVIGVMPQTFRDLNVEEPPDIWLPIGMAPVVYGATALESWTGRMFNAIVRVRPGVSHLQAQQELDAIAAVLGKEQPASNADAGFNAEPLREYFFHRLRRPAIVLLCGAALVLLLGCANVLTLLLLRGRQRMREFAVRAALGAGARRLAAAVVFEAALLVAAGAAAGVVLAQWLVDAIGASGLLPLPAFSRLTLDARVLTASAAFAALAAVVVALVPASRVSRTRGDLLLRGDRGASPHRDRAFQVLVAFEVAFAVLLLAGAAGLGYEFARLRNGLISFPVDHLMTARLDLRSPRYESVDGRRQFYTGLREQLASRLQSGTAAIWGPSIPGRAHFYVEVVGTPAETRDDLVIRPWRHHISPGALGVVGINIVRGRDVEERDDERAPRVAILNKAAADVLWPGGEAIGQRFWFRGSQEPVTVIGLAEDARPTSDMSASMPHAVYVPYRQTPERSMVLLARTPDARSYVNALKESVARLDGGLPVYDIASLRTRLDEENAPVRFGATVMSVYGAIAAGLAAAGVYAVLAFVIASRVREIAIRLALGASPGRVSRMLLAQSLRPVGAGALAGLAAAIVAARMADAAGVPFFAPWWSAVFAAITMLVVAILSGVVLSRRAASAAPGAELAH